MLLDHVGAVFFPWVGLRLIGRLAFPIYCFLLTEGALHTRDPRRYLLRLGVGALLSELPFDLLFYGRFTWAHQSVMVTLLLSFAMLWLLKKQRTPLFQLLLFLGFGVAAEILRCDYGFWGVGMVFLFHITREIPHATLLRTLFLALMGLFMGGLTVLTIPVQTFAAAAMLPIGLYSGKKALPGKGPQLLFYLFYPAHLALLLLIAHL